MIAAKSLWGEIPVAVDLPDLPNKILKEQGVILTEATSGVLVGEVRLGNNENKVFTANLRIKVPSLNNYTFSLAHISYPIGLYPVQVTDQVNGGTVACQNVAAYEQALGKILSSDKAKSVISALLAQVAGNESVDS